MTDGYGCIERIRRLEAELKEANAAWVAWRAKSDHWRNEAAMWKDLFNEAAKDGKENPKP